MAEAQEN